MEGAGGVKVWGGQLVIMGNGGGGGGGGVGYGGMGYWRKMGNG